MSAEAFGDHFAAPQQISNITRRGSANWRSSKVTRQQIPDTTSGGSQHLEVDHDGVDRIPHLVGNTGGQPPDGGQAP